MGNRITVMATAGIMVFSLRIRSRFTSVVTLTYLGFNYFLIRHSITYYLSLTSRLAIYMAQPADTTRVDCLLELPIELEQEILGLAARAYPTHATKLALVSKRAQISIEAIIYETVILNFNLGTTKLFLRTINSRPPEFFAKNVKKLCLTNILTFAQAQSIFAVCTGLTDLGCSVDVPLASGGLLSLIQTRTLERLSVKVEALWRNSPPRRISSRELFPNLSHIDIVNPPSFSIAIDWSWLCDLPALTHISFGDLFAAEHLHVFELLRHLLVNCESLQALIVTSHDPSFLCELQREDIHDPRLVLLPNFHHPKNLDAYWQGIKQGEPDFWALCDEMVTRARTVWNRTRTIA